MHFIWIPHIAQSKLKTESYLCKTRELGCANFKALDKGQ